MLGLGVDKTGSDRITEQIKDRITTNHIPNKHFNESCLDQSQSVQWLEN